MALARIPNFQIAPRLFIPFSRHMTSSPELVKSRLAVASEVKFDMLAAISGSGDHAKQYKAISRNLVCECPDPFITSPYLKRGAKRTHWRVR